MALLTVAGALLSGCVSAGPVRSPEATLPPTFEGPAGALPAQALDRWWLLFGDPQLNSLIDNALARSTDTRRD